MTSFLFVLFWFLVAVGSIRIIYKREARGASPAPLVLQQAP